MMMKHVEKFMIFVLLCTSYLSAESAWTYKGKVEAGAGYLSSKSAESTSDQERISTLDYSGEEEGTVIPALGYSFKAISPDKKTVLFLEDEQFTGINLGVTYKHENSRYGLSASKPLIDGEVWKNPYETSKKREETTVDEFSVEAQYKYLLDSTRFIEVSYAFTNQDVSEDELLLVSEDLARDVQIHEATVNIGTGIFMLGASYAYGDADGKAYTYDEPGLSLGVGGMFAKRWFGLANAKFSRRSYHKENPYFDKKREEDIYSMIGSLRYFAPFGWKNTYGFSSAILSYSDANIDFFDSHTYGMVLGMGYNF